MKKVLCCAMMCCVAAFVPEAQAQSEELEGLELESLLDLSLEKLLEIDTESEAGTRIYGFVNTNFEKVFDEPGVNEQGQRTFTTSPFEWAAPKFFHLYINSRLSSNITVFTNIALQDGSLEIRNAWGDIEVSKLLHIRAGKMYRRFGLYNERLDQIPTFIGIEPPELFDNDHLFLSRTTSFMIHGETITDFGELSYALTTENAEGGASDAVPLGWDIRLKNSSFIIGTSGFTSSINSHKVRPSRGLGDGAPEAGVLPWMDTDSYYILGGFAEAQLGQLLIQTEYWNARHSAQRNPDAVLEVVRNAQVNQQQRRNFLGTAAAKPDAALTASDVITSAEYNVQTFYVRIGYSIPTEIGEFVPYVFYDWMSHPETIANKDFGGDNEAGWADDGVFVKPSIGVVYRPIRSVAVKLDGSAHYITLDNESYSYPEIRMDISFAFR